MERANVLQGGLVHRVLAIEDECANMLKSWFDRDWYGNNHAQLRYLGVDRCRKGGQVKSERPPEAWHIRRQGNLGSSANFCPQNAKTAGMPHAI